MSSRGSLRMLVVVLLAATVATVGAAPAVAKRRVPSGFFGAVLDPGYELQNTVSDSALDSTFGTMASSGVESLRVTFGWNSIQATPTTDDFSVTDRLVADAARHHISLLADLIFTPTWASSHPSGIVPYRYAPKSPTLFAKFAKAVVERYGSHGSFWAQNPRLPRNPVREWQIWNEQGFDVFWATLPWPRSYTALLKAGYVAIHHADRDAKVVAGSLVADSASTQWQQMQALYNAGARHYFDVIAIHPFTSGSSVSVNTSVSRAATIVGYVRNVMRKHGDSRKPIILTEMTWPAAIGFVPRSRLLGLETTPSGEIARLSAAYKYFATHMSQTGVTQAYWFDWASSFNPNDPQSDVSYRFAGLTRFINGAFVAQPVLRTYAHVAALFEGCSKTTAGRCR